ncbi:MAG: hypothetical protein ACNYVW_10965 [Methanosarcinales archaeon]
MKRAGMLVDKWKLRGVGDVINDSERDRGFKSGVQMTYKPKVIKVIIHIYSKCNVSAFGARRYMRAHQSKKA